VSRSLLVRVVRALCCFFFFFALTHNKRSVFARTHAQDGVEHAMGGAQSNETKNIIRVEGTYEGMSMMPYYCRFETTPFAEGAMRWCYAGVVLDEAGRVTRVPDAFPDGRCVVKAFKEGTALAAGSWTDDYLNSYFAQSLAGKFNEQIPTTRPLRFAIPYIAQIDTRAGTKVCKKTRRRRRRASLLLHQEYVTLRNNHHHRSWE
jgi:hypothetical protein